MQFLLFRPRHRGGAAVKRWWHRLKGAAKYAHCRCSGTARAHSDARASRATCCANCPTRQPLVTGIVKRALQLLFGGAVYWTCGPEAEDRPGESCGCLVLAESESGLLSVTVKGKSVTAEPAGKLWCAAESCPQGRWSAEPCST